MASAAQSTTPSELTVSAAATILGTSRHTVYRLIHDGFLSYRQVGLPISRRPTYRVLADEVSQLRQRYERKTTNLSVPHPRKITKHVTTDDLEFIRIA